MTPEKTDNTDSIPVALITGSSQRLGAHIARHLHAQNMRVVIHYRNSESGALALAESLERKRDNSTLCLRADLSQATAPQLMMEKIQAKWGRLDLLVNNASLFYPTPMLTSSVSEWDELMAVNLRAPWLLSKAALPLFGERNACVVNIVDIYADRPKQSYSAYCATKSGLVGLTRAMARDLAPAIRVNAVAPGAILWNDGDTANERSSIMATIPLARLGNPDDIAQAVYYLANAPYVTGQILNIDGGRSIFL